MRFEWRYRGENNDALLAVEDDGDTVLEAWAADAALLADFLNEATGLEVHMSQGNLDINQRDPQQWGELVIARWDSGDVMRIDPELYWDRVNYWFRSRGRRSFTRGVRADEKGIP